MATSFGILGANPTQPKPILPVQTGGTTTPASKALSNASLPQPQMTTGLGSSFFGTPVGQKAPGSPAPTTPVKAVTGVDGSKTEYHAPPKQDGMIQGAGTASNTSSTGHTTVNPGGDNAPIQSVSSSQQGTPLTYPGMIGQASTAAQSAFSTGSEQEKLAFSEAQKNQQALTQSRLDAAKAMNIIGNQPIPIGDITGRQKNTADYYADVQAGLGSAVQGQSNLATVGSTLQGTGVTGLNTSAGLLSPANQYIQQQPNTTLVGADGQPVQQGGQTGGFVNAFTGQPLQSSGNPKLDNAVQNALMMIKNGAGYTNSIAAAGLSTFGPNGTNALNNALPKGFNVNASDATANAQATNIGTVGTTQKSAAAQGYTQALQEQATNTAHYQALSGVSGQVVETLNKWKNTGILTPGNQALNTIAGLTSDPDYQQFIVAMNNTKAAYQAALGSLNVAPTQAETDSLQALNPNSSSTAILAALNQLSKDAHSILIEPSYAKTAQFASQLGY